MTPHRFIEKWRASELKVRSASQEHFIDLCRLLGERTPAEADPAEWTPEKAGVAAELERAEVAKSPAARTKRRNEAERRIGRSLNRLRVHGARPACGAGNFL